MSNRSSATLVALALCACTAAKSHAQAQTPPKESTPTFSLFGGGVLDESSGLTTGGLNNLEFGGSADFRVAGLPVPLRATLAFRSEKRWSDYSAQKFGTLSLDAVGRPIPRFFGVQPYLLGGLGVATSSNYFTTSYQFGPDFLIISRGVRSVPRNTWAFAEGGIGLEFGRHLFVQTKIMAPVASQGPIMVPFSVGFRFWD